MNAEPIRAGAWSTIARAPASPARRGLRPRTWIAIPASVLTLDYPTTVHVHPYPTAHPNQYADKRSGSPIVMGSTDTAINGSSGFSVADCPVVDAVSVLVPLAKAILSQVGKELGGAAAIDHRRTHRSALPRLTGRRRPSHQIAAHPACGRLVAQPGSQGPRCQVRREDLAELQLSYRLLNDHRA